MVDLSTGMVHVTCTCFGNRDKLHHVCFRAPLIDFFEFFENAEIDFTKVTINQFRKLLG